MEHTIQVQEYSGKPIIDLDLRKVSSVVYTAAAAGPPPKRAHLRITVNDDGGEKQLVFKGSHAEATWMLMVPASRSGDLQGAMELVTSRVKRLTRVVDALVRVSALERADLPYPQKFVARRARLMSNDEEDGITLAILSDIRVTNRTFVEVACGSNGGNSGFLALECGWRGLMVDGDEERLAAARRRFRYADVTFANSFVTKENIDCLLAENGIDGDIDLMSIDIDGNDFWIWEGLTAATPRLIIIEYNSYFGPDKSVVVPYSADFDRHNYINFFYGASIQAMTKLAARKGYRLIATEPRGHNAYFLRNDVAPSIPATDPAAAWRLLDKYELRVSAHREDPYAFAERAGIELVQVD